jgi:argininosuccinate lyase
LKQIAALNRKGRFAVPWELEDSHTAIEVELTKSLGGLGKRIHTGRSRNDQSALMMRLFLRRSLTEILTQTLDLLPLLERFYRRQGQLLIPGYTHLQPAMPSSVGMWLHSIYEGLLRFAQQAITFHKILNECPLGSGAGFGSSFKLDRSHVAKFLGFYRAQRSFIDVNNSRGRIDEMLLQVLSQLAFTADKIASDLMLFLSKEFALVRLSEQLKTGSSIMPQKNNPDLVELLRARTAVLRSTQVELMLLNSKLASSYHRDLQFSKEPALRGVRTANEILSTLRLLLENISFDSQRAKQLLYPELYATFQANRLVKEGLAFRDAYLEVAKQLKDSNLHPEDFAAEMSEPLRQTQVGFQAAQRERIALSKQLRELQKIEKSCERLLA